MIEPSIMKNRLLTFRYVKKFSGIGLLVIAFLIPVHVEALSIRTYDKMDSTNQVQCLMLMIKGSTMYLNAQKKSDEAKRLADLFSQKQTDPAALGFFRFGQNLQVVRRINKENEDDSTKSQYDIEHVFALTLKNEKINVPMELLKRIGKKIESASNLSAPQTPATVK